MRNEEKRRQYLKIWRANRTLEQKEEKRQAHRKWILLQKYGLELEDYAFMLSQQCGNCYICKKPQPDKDLAVDHCHTTGQIRKLLCSNCNIALGLIGDDIDLGQALCDYIEAHAQLDPSECKFMPGWPK